MQALINSSGSFLTLNLQPSQVLRLPRHTKISVCSGKLWLTRPNQVTDEIVGAGASVTAVGEGVLIEAVQASTVELIDAPSPNDISVLTRAKDAFSRVFA